MIVLLCYAALALVGWQIGWTTGTEPSILMNPFGVLAAPVGAAVGLVLAALLHIGWILVQRLARSDAR